MSNHNYKTILLHLVKYATLDESHYKYEKELNELLNKGFIKLVDTNFNGRKKYSITRKGEEYLDNCN